MSNKLIGIYVLMMWAYNYPYAARTWRLKDWSAYLEGLRALGYNLVQIWPFVDAIPVPMTPSDRALLATLRQVIDVAHELGMTVYIGSCANTMANDKAGDYDFESRPYFTVQKRIDPTDRNAVAELMTIRRELLDGLAAWAQQHGYTDRFRGPFRTLIRPVLEQVATQTRDSERLRQAMDGCDARDVNGVFTELLDSLKGLQLK